MTATMENVEKVGEEMAGLSEIETGLSRGTAFFTPARVQSGLRLRIGDIIRLPKLTPQDVARMKRLNHGLIWQPEQTAEGAPITMKALQDACGNKCHQDGKLLYGVDWYPKEGFYLQQMPRGGWREVSLAPIPQSLGKTFCGQLRALVDYIRTEIWPDGLPDEVQVAIAEFEGQEASLLKLEQSDWREAAKRESTLQICRWLTTPVEQTALMLVHQQTNGERFLERVWSRTPILSSNGGLVNSGYFDSDGAGVDVWSPDGADDGLGVCFSAEVKS